MKRWKLLAAVLDLFEGDGAVAAGSGAEGTSQAAAETESKGEKVIYGKPPVEEAPEEPVAASQEEVKEDLEKDFDELIKGKYKDQYSKRTQEMIDKRYAKAKAAQKAMSDAQPLLDILGVRYGVDGTDISAITQAVQNDEEYWNILGDERGMTANQARDFARMEANEMRQKRAMDAELAERRASERIAKWNQEEAALRESFPEFSLQAEVEGPYGEKMLNLMRMGVSVGDAYRAIHFDEINETIMRRTAVETEKKVIDNVRARGNRPQENGVTRQAGVTYKSDPSKYTKEDRAEIARRVRRGESISF